ncbi:MAG TPA: tetratricopeptide repeat protein, partial [Sphingomicrobium sp.]
MTKSNRLGTALTAVSLAALTAGCAGTATGPRSASIFGGPANSGKLGVATRAQAALASNDVVTAIKLAEEAVEGSPRDAGFRSLLGNCYLAAGRFASAEAAYRDSISLLPAQPQVILKLALMQIAQGRQDEAKQLLAEAQTILNPADTGLALALAGDPQAAVAVLDEAARSRVSDSRTRQNLALAHALAGDWAQARIVASQDVPADQLDARIEQWMALANPARKSDQVAAFIGIQPVAGDPGQPVRLALNKNEAVRQAAAEPVAQPVPASEIPADLTSTATVELPQVAEPTPEPVALAAAEPVPAVPAYAAPEPQVEPVKLAEARPALSPAAVRLADPLPKPRKASAARASANGKSRAVVQLGAYSSRERVAAAWNKVSGKH